MSFFFVLFLRFSCLAFFRAKFYAVFQYSYRSAQPTVTFRDHNFTSISVIANVSYNLDAGDRRKMLKQTWERPDYQESGFFLLLYENTILLSALELR
jgi:hypothetical protein